MTVEDTWTRLEERLRTDAPRLHASPLPPAGPGITGLPPDLAAWWRVFGGVDRGALGDESPLLPRYWHPLDVRVAVNRRTSDRIPLAVDCHEDDQLLFADLRTGHVFSDEMTEWPSVGAMLDQVLRLCEHGRDRDREHRLLRYDDGHIGWD
ncbi:hypothetical protein [Lentzea albida]|uniref:SMI1 / KNR4 family (SUKH-1) n=1 Tax=Lentzea albida TaxID=65499 RepID=A0A1H9RMC1_9PSEU|nr:hypothetical protein [Lentzea albida]SER73625.1 hypothetical protein SAMN04488000_111181 [Lentzea albida]